MSPRHLLAVSRVVLTLALTTLIACSGSPDKVKREAFQRGNTYADKRQFPEAILEYRRAVQADPNYGEARRQLSKAYLETGDYANAFRESIRAADLLPKNAEAQVDAGNLLLAVGRFEDARARADKVIEQAPDNADAHVLRGNALAGMKNLDEALTEYETAAAAAPQNGLIHSNIGFVHMAQGAKADAEESFRKATELSPKSAMAYVSYANYLFAAKDTERAEEQLKKALDVAPDDVTVHRALAILYVLTKRPEMAEPHLRKIADVSNDPKGRFALARFYFALNRPDDAMRELTVLAGRKDSYADATLEIAGVRYTQGQTADARRLLSDVLKQFPANARAHLVDAQFLSREGKWPEAVVAAKTATERDPHLAEAFFVLGLAYEQTRDYEAAKNAFSEVLRLEPNATAAQLALADLNLLMRDASTAQQLATQAATRAPHALEVQMTLIRSMLANNDLTSAATAIKAFTADFPDREEPFLLEGTLHLMRKEYDAATRAFNKASEISPTSLNATAGRIEVLLSTGRTSEVRQLLERATIFNDNKPPYLVLAAKTYLLMRDYPSAERLLLKALDVDASNSDTYNLLGQTYLAQNKLDDALREYQNLASRQAKSIPAHTMVATILLMKNQRPAAKAAYRSVLAIDSGAPVAANNLAWMMAEDGEDLDSALQLAQTAKAKLPNDPNTADTLGWVYMKKGFAAQAVDEFKEALAKDPANADFKYRLGLAYAQTGAYTEARRTLESALSMNAKSPQAEEARATLARLARQGS